MKKGRWHRLGLICVLIALLWAITEGMPLWATALLAATGCTLYINGPD